MNSFSVRKSYTLTTILLAAISCLPALIVSCGGADNTAELHYSRASCLEGEATCDINGFLGSLLSESTILFIGDMEPGIWRHRNALVEFLDYWSRAPEDSFATSFSDLRDLTLILGLDSLQLERARAYMESWDFADLASMSTFCSEEFSSADLELYWRLGNVLHRVARRSRDNDGTARLNLALLAADPDLSEARMSLEEEGRYYVSQRDLAIAQRIAAYQLEQPKSKLLAFLRGHYIQRGRHYRTVNKQTDSTFFVASSLDSLWGGEQSFATVAQANRSRWPFALWEGQPDCDLIVPCGKINDALIKGEAAPLLLYDALIVRSEDHYDLHLPIRAIPSAYVARLIVSELDSLAEAGDQSNSWIWKKLDTYLHAVSGIPPQTFAEENNAYTAEMISSWKKWAAGPEPDIVAEIASLQLWSRLVDSLEVAPNSLAVLYDGEIISILPEAPPFDIRFGAPSRVERAAQLREYLADNRSRVVQRTLINLLWVGSELEKQNALAELCRQSGLDYGTPSEWSRWFRSGGQVLWE